MRQIDLREGARRQHRAVALLAVIQCWLRGLDGLAFERQNLQRLLGLVRFKGKRVEWLQEDLSEFFPYQQVYWFSGKLNSLSSIFISRVPLDGHLPSGKMTTAKRVDSIKDSGLRLALFQMWSVPDRDSLREAFDGLAPFLVDRVNFDERLLSAYLALLAQGQISPKSLPPPTEAT